MVHAAESDGAALLLPSDVQAPVVQSNASSSAPAPAMAAPGGSAAFQRRQLPQRESHVDTLVELLLSAATNLASRASGPGTS